MSVSVSILILAIGLPVSFSAIAGSAMAAADTTSTTGGYPYADAPCQSQTWSGTMSNGQQGTACPNDNWVYQDQVNNPDSGYAYRNCTDYVAWKIMQTEGIKVPAVMGDASDWGTWYSYSGNYPVPYPSVGAIAWEPHGDHVAYVESVDVYNSEVTISEYNEHYRAGDPKWGDGTYDERTVPESDFEYIVVGTPKSHQSTATPPTTPAKPAAPVSGPFPPKYTWTWSTVASGGYKFSGKLTIGTPEHVNSASTLQGFGSSPSAVTSALRSACSGFNAQTDAVIPTAIMMRNNTAKFSADVYMVIFADPNNLSSVQVAGAYRSGVTCHTVSTAQNAYFDGDTGWDSDFPDVAPNTSAGTGYAYIVLPHYFSPDSPKGNSYILNHSVLELASYIYLKDGQQIVRFSGPGYDQGDNKRLGLLPLNGQQVPCQGVNC